MSGPRAEARLAAAGVTTIGGLAALSDPDLRSLLPGAVGRMLRDRALGIDPRGLETTSERISISVEETFERDLEDRTLLHAELRRMAGELGQALVRDGLAARTVTAKLRYADFSIRSRSTSLEVGIDDPARIGELACALLDRGLRDRPGALRLVGVGLSGLSGHRQLSLENRLSREARADVAHGVRSPAELCAARSPSCRRRSRATGRRPPRGAPRRSRGRRLRRPSGAA